MLIARGERGGDIDNYRELNRPGRRIRGDDANAARPAIARSCASSAAIIAPSTHQYRQPQSRERREIFGRGMRLA